MTVFVLQHSYELDGRAEVKFIGVYSTEALAMSAAARLRDRPGFPDGFHTDPYELDINHWSEGFVIA